MAQNVLFNFIKLYIITTKTTSISHYPTEDTNKEGTHYYRYNLQKNKQILLSDDGHSYRLKKHHLSVYETEIDKNPTLSQYHYTAYFSDENGEDYQLHVHFNERDLLTNAPVFSKGNDKTSGFALIPNEELNEAFINLATSSIEPIISELRKQVTEQIQKLEASYRSLEENACNLADKIEDNHKQYELALDKIIKTLDQLIPLTKHNHYEQIKNFLNILKKNIARQPLQPKAKPTAKTQKESATTNNKASFPASELSAFAAPPKSSQRQKNTLDIDKELDKLSTTFSSLPTAESNRQPDILGELNAEINTLSLILEESDATSLSSVKRLKKLHGEIHKAGEELLRNLLKKGEFTLAEKLPAFHYLLTTQYLIQALRSRNHELLDFLLSKGNFAINNQPLTINANLYSSAVYYCYKQNCKNKPMVDCLSVLLKHNASILVKEENGLPIAHIILSTPNHPLQSALTANQEKKLNSVSLYKSLIADLQLYLSQKQLEESQRLDIEIAILGYKDKVQNLLALSVLATPAGRVLEEKSDSVGKKHGEATFGKDNLEKLKKDPHVCQMISIFNTTRKEFMQKLPKSQQSMLLSKSTSCFENIDKFLDTVSIKITDYEIAKKMIIQYIMDMIAMNEKQSRLFELKKQLQQPEYNGKRTKVKKESLKEYEDLVNEIKKIMGKYPDIYDSGYTNRIWNILFKNSSFLYENEHEKLTKLTASAQPEFNSFHKIMSFLTNLIENNLDINLDNISESDEDDSSPDKISNAPEQETNISEQPKDDSPTEKAASLNL
jgi:hypothetical protein